MELPRLLTAMITPFAPDGQVDYNGAANLAKMLVKSGSEGLVVAGTTGESPTLSDEEKLTLFRTVKDAVGDTASVWAGTSSNDTAHAVELTKEAHKLGVDGILAVAPYYNKPSQEGLYRHFKAMAEAVPLPVMVYNIPGRTGINIQPETMVRLAQVDNITSVKEAAGSIDQVSQLRASLPPDFHIYSGDDSMTLPMLAVGARGVVSVASHVAGLEISDMIASFVAGNVRRALEIHLRLWPLFKVLFITSNPVPLKTGLAMMGIASSNVRLPLAPCSDREASEIRQVFTELGYIS